MAEALARLHAVRPEAIGLSDYGRPGNYFARQIARWSRQYRESASERIPTLDRVTAWLQENQPEDDGRVAIAHGDFRLGNMLFHPTRPEWLRSSTGNCPRSAIRLPTSVSAACPGIRRPTSTAVSSA